jgi:pyruvate dehydrogenase (quinone)
VADGREIVGGAISWAMRTTKVESLYAATVIFLGQSEAPLMIAIDGDGSMQMNGINALIDVAKYRDRWSDPRFIVLVLNNQDSR